MLNCYEVRFFVSRHIVNKGRLYPVLADRRSQLRKIPAVHK